MAKRKLYRHVTIFLILSVMLSCILGGYAVSAQNHATQAQGDGLLINGVEPPNDAQAQDIGNDGQSIYEPYAFMFKIHDGKKNLSISNWYNKILSVDQFSQSLLNRAYNQKYSANINGTCGCVAMATVTYYYRHKLSGFANLPESINDIFDEYVKMYGLQGNEGTYSDTYKLKIKEYFARYGYNVNTERTTHLYKFTKIREQIDAGRPVVIAVNGSLPYDSHAMVVVGYKKYEVKYKNWIGVTVTEEDYMYVIDEGWGRELYAYLHEDYMPDTWEITTMMPA